MRHFYHAGIRKYTILFGAIFSNIFIERETTDGNTAQSLRVPIEYGPHQKFIARLDQTFEGKDPDATKRQLALILPRMTFEMGNNIVYAPNRKLNNSSAICGRDAAGNLQQLPTPIPYDLPFSLSIITKTLEDGFKIVEQILPKFTPTVTYSVKLFSDLDYMQKVPLTLQSVIKTDNYEGRIEERRTIVWTFNFILQANFYDPIDEATEIKTVITTLDMLPC